ncbi:MAG: VIT1/CCC1 transporter family protein [Bacillota bacterium]|nr:VIT1/CCC1 transporter family protein [Bacillota bacterium]
MSKPAEQEHLEQHFTGGAWIRDVILGMSDGLTVPFALAAGISGAVAQNFLVVIAGFAELAAGAISMGLGGYLAARSELDTYRSELARERREVVELPDVERQEVREIFERYGLRGATLEQAVGAIASDREAWVRFMMREELGLEEPEPARALRSGLTIGASYVAGGIVPLAPYLLPVPVRSALLISAVVTLAALLLFGWLKGSFTGLRPWRSALQTALVGGIAAGVAYALARAISAVG